MKIRNDFITNSSSTQFLVSFEKGQNFDSYMKQYFLREMKKISIKSPKDYVDWIFNSIFIEDYNSSLEKEIKYHDDDKILQFLYSFEDKTFAKIHLINEFTNCDFLDIDAYKEIISNNSKDVFNINVDNEFSFDFESTVVKNNGNIIRRINL